MALSLSADRAFSGTGFARKTAFRREKSEENFPGRRKRQKLPGRSQTNAIKLTRSYPKESCKAG
ncbi:hypothetical protein, partial [uncultured Oscillibacter sp.]|uniref:hypothetical protein n=1 Tax=uncultured Oscillibacter sp. TaxID=876091 RepID=UPI002616C272